MYHIARFFKISPRWASSSSCLILPASFSLTFNFFSVSTKRFSICLINSTFSISFPWVRRKSPAAKSRARNERSFWPSECTCLVRLLLHILFNILAFAALNSSSVNAPMEWRLASFSNSSSWELLVVSPLLFD